MKSIVIGMGLMMLCAANSTLAQSYEFTVEHQRTLRNHTGKLIITPERIEYHTDHKNESRIWQYNELRQITIASPTEIVLTSYEDQKRVLGMDRVYKFILLEGRITPAISALLLEKSPRPLATSVMPTDEDAPLYNVPVKHLHRFGGCLGALKIYADRIVYEAHREENDSRYWRYRDVQSFSQSERFRFEIVGFEDTHGGSKAYNFQLREELPAQAYDYVWARVYPSKLHHAQLTGTKQEARFE